MAGERRGFGHENYHPYKKELWHYITYHSTYVLCFANLDSLSNGE